MSRPRIIFYTGMACDERLLGPQRALDAEVSVQPWLIPRRGETVAGYAVRSAEALESDGPYCLGGVSFGGMLPYEMAQHLGPNLRGLIMISACRSSRQVPWVNRTLGMVGSLLPAFARKLGPVLLPVIGGRFGVTTRQQRRFFSDMLGETDARFLKWALYHFGRWPGPGRAPDVPILQIHGGDDRIIPVEQSGATDVIPGAGHIVNVSHAQQVNQCIAKWLKLVV